MEQHERKDQTSQKSVSELTPAQVRRELARLVDGVYIEQADTGAYLVINGNAITHRYEKRAWAERRVDEVADKYKSPGAALALCLEIAREHNCGWTVCTAPNSDGTIGARFLHYAGGHVVTVGWPMLQADGATPAEALARLALRALEGGAR